MNKRQSLIMGLVLSALSAAAQTYPQKEGSTNINYRLISAYAPVREQMLCLQDSTSNTTSSFKYQLHPYQEDEKLQNWVLVTADATAETYYVQNQKNRRYIVHSDTQVQGWTTFGYTTARTSAGVIKVTQLGDDEVSLTIQTTDGERYISMVDLQNEKTSRAVPSKLKDTRWAWYIYRTDSLATGIMQRVTLEPEIQVKGRIITVNGAQDWRVYDLQGREMPRWQALKPGAYVVRTESVSRKIFIR